MDTAMYGEYDDSQFFNILGDETAPSMWMDGNHSEHNTESIQQQQQQQQVQQQQQMQQQQQQSQNYKKRKTSAGNPEGPGFLQDYADNFVGPDGTETNSFSAQPEGVGRAPRRVCDMVNLLASRQTSLMFDPSTELFTVLDGDAFHREFVALKASKGKNEPSDRVFAQMYRTYQIVNGERWGCTGTSFKTKKRDTPLPTMSGQPVSSPDHASVSSPENGNYANANYGASRSTSVSTPVPENKIIMADSVAISVTNEVGQKSQISLQNFLDVTGAGQLYSAAMAQGNTYDRVNGPMAWMQHESRRMAPLCAQDLGEVVGGLWNASSKGDQAYFFKRKGTEPRMTNGAIVGLVGGELTSWKEVEEQGGLYMVVSDDNAKWKGEPIPLPQEEHLGHWCCFLGQVPVVVSGAVKCGDHIGPRAEDGVAVVTSLGKGPVVGTALQDKQNPAPGIVKVMCFAGLNAVSGGHSPDGQYQLLLDKAVALEAKVNALDRNVQQLDSRVDLVEGNVAGTAGRVEALEREVTVMSKVFSIFGREHGLTTRDKIWISFGLLILVAVVVVVIVLVTGESDQPDPVAAPVPTPLPTPLPTPGQVPGCEIPPGAPPHPRGHPCFGV